MRVLIVFLMSLILTACSAAPAAKPEQDVPPPETEETVLPEESGETLRYETEMTCMEDALLAEDGTPLLTYAFQIPLLTVCREDGTPVPAEGEALTPEEERALAVTAAFNGRFETWLAEEDVAGRLEIAQEDWRWHREEGLDWHGGYAWELTCGIYRTERVISVSGLYYSYTGGAHPNTNRLCWNFDLEEGVFFEPEILADGTELRSVVAAEILRQARIPREDGYIPAEGYWEDYETLIADWSSYAVSFDETGMTVVFSPYELAPYAAGPQEFHMTYDWLKPYLSARGRVLLGLEAAE